MIGNFIGAAIGEPLGLGEVVASGALVQGDAKVTLTFYLGNRQTILQRHGPGGQFTRSYWRRLKRKENERIAREEARLVRQLKDAIRREEDARRAEHERRVGEWLQAKQQELAQAQQQPLAPIGKSLAGARMPPSLAVSAAHDEMRRKKQRDMALAAMLLLE